MDYLQDSGGGYAPDSAESTDADNMYDSQVSSLFSNEYLFALGACVVYRV